MEGLENLSLKYLKRPLVEIFGKEALYGYIILIY